MSSSEIVIPWPGGRLTLRPETDNDLIFRFELFCQSRAPEWSQVEMPDALRLQLMHHQFAAQKASYGASYPRARFDIIELDGEPIGRIVVDREPWRIHLVDQAIVPQRRGQGLGGAIMAALIDEARGKSIPITLMVANSNDPSMRLYSRMGFVPTEETELYLQMTWRPEAA